MKDTFELTGTILHETAAALLIAVDGSQYWLPFSQIYEIHRSVNADVEDRLLISKWIATKKGLVK